MYLVVLVKLLIKYIGNGDWFSSLKDMQFPVNDLFFYYHNQTTLSTEYRYISQ